LALRGFQHQHQIGRTEETSLVAFLGGEITYRDSEVEDSRNSSNFAE
jgi:hypothetical protein